MSSCSFPTRVKNSVSKRFAVKMRHGRRCKAEMVTCRSGSLCRGPSWRCCRRQRYSGATPHPMPAATQTARTECGVSVRKLRCARLDREITWCMLRMGWGGLKGLSWTKRAASRNCTYTIPGACCCAFLSAKGTWFPNTWVWVPKNLSFPNWAMHVGNALAKQQSEPSVTTPPSCWRYKPSARATMAMPTRQTHHGCGSLNPHSPIAKRRIN